MEIYHYEDYADECDGEAGWTTWYPRLVTCPACIQRMEDEILKNHPLLDLESPEFDEWNKTHTSVEDD